MPKGVYKRTAQGVRNWIAGMKRNGSWLHHSKASRKRHSDSMKRAKRFGAKHWNWKGNFESGHSQARILFPKSKLKRCSRCGTKKNLERHHKDENTINNKPSNIKVLCHACHAFLHSLTRKRNLDGTFAKVFSSRDARLKRIVRGVGANGSSGDE